MNKKSTPSLCIVQCFLLLISILAASNLSQAQTCSGIYVTPNGSSAGLGTQANPTNMVQGIAIYKSDTTRRIIQVLEGVHIITQTLDIPSGIVIEGGYKIAGGNWVKGDSTNKSILDINPYQFQYDSVYDPYSASYKDVVSLIGVKLDSVHDIYMSQLGIRLHGHFAAGYAYDSYGGGYTSYGIYARHSQTVVLNKVDIQTDKSGDGMAGMPGRNGGSAVNRKAGGWEISPATTNSQNPQYQMVAGTSIYTAGGIGGKGGRIQEFQPCTGSPVCYLTPCVLENPQPSGDGGGPSGNNSIAGGTGGMCGDGCKFDCTYDNYQHHINKPELAANIYNHGEPTPSQLNPYPIAGTNGQHGTGNWNGPDYTGQQQAQIGDKFDFYLPSNGASGGSGAGGGGGAGGGAGAIRVFALPPAGLPLTVSFAKIAFEDALVAAGVNVCESEVLNFPGRGGDGGGGGEGGGGGVGGGGGGGNFGIYAVQGSSIGLVNSVMQPGAGGSGGPGGLGGHGGIGAPGKEAEITPNTVLYPNDRGARGGNGGNGEDGRNGQAGHNGDVFGFFSSASSNNPNDTAGIIADYKKACTNSAINIFTPSSHDQLTINPGDNLIKVNPHPPGTTAYNNFNSSFANITVYAPALGTGKVTINNAGVFQQRFRTITITDSRPVPVINSIPNLFCAGDTLYFSSPDIAGKYLWKVYNGNGYVIKTYNIASGYYTTATDTNSTVYLSLEEYDECCGWSIPTFTNGITVFQSYIKPGLQFAFNINKRYCEGTDSTRIIELYGGGGNGTIWKWSNGATNPNEIYVHAAGPIWLQLEFPNGCKSLYSDTLYPNILPLPNIQVVPLEQLDVCDNNPNSENILLSNPGYNMGYTFFLKTQGTPGVYYPVEGATAQDNYTIFSPAFQFPYNTDTVIYYYSTTDRTTGCIAAQKAPIRYTAHSQLPTVTSPTTYTFATNSNCQLSFLNYPQPTGNGGCYGFNKELISTTRPGTYNIPIGQYIDRWVIYDRIGRHFYWQDTIKIENQSPPIISNCPADVQLYADTTCGATFTIPYIITATDCGQQVIATDTTPTSSTWALGINPVWRSFTDAKYRTSTCLYNVIVSDTARPIGQLPNYTFDVNFNSCYAYVSYSIQDALANSFTDNCTTPAYLTYQLVSGKGEGQHVLKAGVYTEVWDISDRSGNTIRRSFTITVNNPAKPIITGISSLNVVAGAGLNYATLNYLAPTATSTCGIESIYLVSGPDIGDTAHLGIHTAIWEVRDSSGNTARWEFPITVSDAEGPVVAPCPQSIIQQADSGVCGAVINFNVPAQVLDNDGNFYPVILATGLPNSSVFPVGVTQQYFRTQDAHGNPGGCAFKVTIIDTIPPVYTYCPNDTILYATPGYCTAQGVIPQPVVVDGSCALMYSGFYSGDAYAYLGNQYDVGTTTQIYKAADVNFNISSCSYNVTVVDTVTYTILCPPANIYRNTDPGQCGVTTGYVQPRIQPTLYNDCYTSNITRPANFFYPLGVTTDMYNYTIGNTHLSCSVDVTVTDNQAPIINCGHDTVVYATDGMCGAVIDFTEPSVVDNCPASGLLFSQLSGYTSGSMFPIGTTKQKYLATSGFFNNVTAYDSSCQFYITVLDTVRPHIAAIADVSAHTNSPCGTVVNFTEPIGTDNSGCATTIRISGISSGQVFPMGNTVQKYEVTDLAGNIDTCMFNVYVSPDLPLQVGCLSPPSVHSTDGQGAIVPAQIYTTPGNFCAGTTTVFASGKGPGAYYPVGISTDTYYIIDRLGDTATCNIQVHVFETNPPILTCPPALFVEVDPSEIVNCKAYVTVPPAIATDPSGIDGFYNNFNNTADASGYYTIGTQKQVAWRAESQGMSALCVTYVLATEKVSSTEIVNIPNRQPVCEGLSASFNTHATPLAGVIPVWKKYIGNIETFYSNDTILTFDSITTDDGGFYTLYFKSACSEVYITSFNVIVKPTPEVHIAGLGTDYCFNDAAGYPIVTSPPGGILSGSGVVNGIFYPAQSDTGLVTITYTRDTSGIIGGSEVNPGTPWACSNTATLLVRVNNNPALVDFIAPAYCINADAIQLDNANSSYSGVGINGSTFNASIAGGGPHIITRTLSQGGCTISYTNTTTISTDVPDATILTTGPYCNNVKSILLEAIDTGGLWIADSSVITLDSLGRNLFTPVYANPGLIPLKYIVTRGVCTAMDSINILVKDYRYNAPLTLPDFCINGPPVIFDSTNKTYLGHNFANNVLHTNQFAHGGVQFYFIIGTNAIGCQDTSFRMYLLHGPDVPFGREQLACVGDSTQVNLASGAFTQILWDNGSTDTLRWLSQAGSVNTVLLTDTFGCTGVDTVRFNYYTKPDSSLTLIGDTLWANAVGLSYQWYKDSALLVGATANHIGPTTMGSYYVVLVDSNGCISNSIVYFMEDSCLPTVKTNTIALCNGEAIVVGLHTYTATGIYTDTMAASTGCDSIIITNLTVNPAIATSLTQIICEGGSVTIGIHTYSTSGTFNDTLTATNGCDSIVNLQLTVQPIGTTNIAASICANSTYTFNGTALSAAGTYVDTLATVTGCDSIIVLQLTLETTLHTVQALTLCPGQSVNVGTHTYTVAGTYTDTLSASGGCDSVVTTTLSMALTYATAFSYTICSNETYSFAGLILNTPGITVDTLSSVSGCDSVVTLTLMVLPATGANLTASICEGTTYNFNGTVLSSAGTYSDTLTSVNGCDSIITLALSINPVATTTLSEAICMGRSFNFGGLTLTTGGVYYDTLQATDACDSIVTLTLTVLPSISNTVTAGICSGDSYDFNGTALFASGTYFDTLTAGSGCDSAVALTLTVWPLPALPLINKVGDTLSCVSSGVSYNWYFNGNALNPPVTTQSIVVSQTGTYEVEVADNHGCTNRSAALNVSSVSINEILPYEVKLFPNPSNGTFMVTFSDMITREVTITDMSGRLIMSAEEVTGQHAFRLNLSSGLYLLGIKQSGTTKNLRFSILK